MARSAADLNFAVLKRLDPAVEEVRERGRGGRAPRGRPRRRDQGLAVPPAPAAGPERERGARCALPTVPQVLESPGHVALYDYDTASSAWVREG